MSFIGFPCPRILHPFMNPSRFKATSERAKIRDGVFDVRQRIRRFAAFDRYPAAEIEFGEPAEQLGKIGRAAAELDLGRSARSGIANGVTGVHVNDVRSE